ncbi:hypothetical protein [Algisphaera agarilytica]|uniref:Uncharacterized protein n=1 Tax=Algisphaera agarilytica TaxID=1385975 RepID=A0A7X0H3S5_9BACT|nr:hypothetical protein [Algisphaera agarilytica]MBB6428527.1 hypothetical protein [Algisphaera agarilytica]
MRPSLGPSSAKPANPRDLSATMALLVVATAVCVSVSTGGLAVSTHPADRRITAETDEAVASFMACLNEAAKTLAGQTAAVVDSPATTLDLPAYPAPTFVPENDRPVVSLLPHLSLLNLPPPAALS